MVNFVVAMQGCREYGPKSSTNTKGNSTNHSAQVIAFASYKKAA
jgi:hypothetical protein